MAIPDATGTSEDVDSQIKEAFASADWNTKRIAGMGKSASDLKLYRQRWHEIDKDGFPPCEKFVLETFLTSEQVIVITGARRRFIATYYIDKAQWYSSVTGDSIENVTHWKPLDYPED
jgi:hypothetical protein